MTERVEDKINGGENRPGMLSRGDADVDKEGKLYNALYLLFFPEGIEISLGMSERLREEIKSLQVYRRVEMLM